MGLDPGVFGRFDLAALVQPHLKYLFVCLLMLFLSFGAAAGKSHVLIKVMCFAPDVRCPSVFSGLLRQP